MKNTMFSNKDLRKLIVPLFLEQLLMALVGMADVFVIGFVGEAAVSGVWHPLSAWLWGRHLLLLLASAWVQAISHRQNIILRK